MNGDPPTAAASDSADAAEQPAAASGSTDAEIDLSELIDLTRLKPPEEFKAALCKESVVHWMSMSRLELLQHLKSRLGVEKLADRQAIANGFGRKRRAQNGDPPPPVPIKPPDWFTAQAHACEHEPRPVSPDSSAPRPIWQSSTGLPTPAGGDATRAEVRAHLLTGAAGYEHRGSYVRVRYRDRPRSIRNWTDAFGECSDSSCGCYRLGDGPSSLARGTFRNAVVQRTVAQLRHGWHTADNPVRYVSVGCGLLLTDFEILCGLQEKGLPIESIVFVDRCYAGSPKDCTEAFRLVAGFFDSARVCAFGSLDDLRQAAAAAPAEYGTATTYIHCDAEDIGGESSRALAARLLVSGGHAFQLHNNGRAHNSREAWRRRAESPSAGDPPRRRYDYEWARLLDSVSLGYSEGAEPLMTVRDIAQNLHVDGVSLYRVVHSKDVVVRSAPSTEGRVLGLRKPGTEVLVGREQIGADGKVWVQLRYEDPLMQREHWTPAKRNEYGGEYEEQGPDWAHGRRAAWMLTDGSHLGFGTLLAKVNVATGELVANRFLQEPPLSMDLTMLPTAQAWTPPRPSTGEQTLAPIQRVLDPDLLTAMPMDDEEILHMV